MRSRNIKPAFFLNDLLAECDPLARVLFIGLWCFADREGRFEWRPRKIKAAILPYDNGADIENLLSELENRGFIECYMVEDQKYGWIPKFPYHQKPHRNEAQSKIPPSNGHTKDTPRTYQGMTKDTPRTRQGGLNEERGMRNDERGIRKDESSTLKSSEEAKEVLDYLNDKAGKQYRHTDENLEYIFQRLQEGFTIEKCKQVIDLKMQDDWFLDNPKYLSPETLFKPSNFERYLNEKPKKPLEVVPRYKELKR